MAWTTFMKCACPGRGCVRALDLSAVRSRPSRTHVSFLELRSCVGRVLSCAFRPYCRAAHPVLSNGIHPRPERVAHQATKCNSSGYVYLDRNNARSAH
eukprot:2142094-Pleurochrysis_carterae.AAC.2